MKKEIALKLKATAKEAAKNFSKGERQGNMNGEKFQIDKIKPLSEDAATVTFLKSTGKRAIAFFYYMHMYQSWKYFFPTDGQLLAMGFMPRVKMVIEEANFYYNGD